MISKLLRRLSLRRRVVSVSVQTVTRDQIRARTRQLRRELGMGESPALRGDV